MSGFTKKYLSAGTNADKEICSQIYSNASLLHRQCYGLLFLFISGRNTQWSQHATILKTAVVKHPMVVAHNDFKNCGRKTPNGRGT